MKQVAHPFCRNADLAKLPTSTRKRRSYICRACRKEYVVDGGASKNDPVDVVVYTPKTRRLAKRKRKAAKRG